jgi:hypothetical protein
MSITPTVYAKARSEVLGLFGWNADSLSPDQMLRVDCAVALRLALDDLQGRIVRGESIDVNRMLTAAEALGRLLPPAVLASPPPGNRVDPRQVMWETYLGMRRRGELGERVQEPTLRQKIAELEAEVERLKAAGGSAPVESGAAAPLPDNVVPLKPPVASAPGVPEEEYEEVVVTEAVLGTPEPWRNFLGPNGTICPTSRGGKWWGPV